MPGPAAPLNAWLFQFAQRTRHRRAAGPAYGFLAVQITVTLANAATVFCCTGEGFEAPFFGCLKRLLGLWKRQNLC